KDLKEYSEEKRQGNLYGKVVFYYRADLINDEQKEKIVDFKNYDNEGKWYIILDEAHKGDREESKRKHIYSILSRNGFLFNFSATFTDKSDIITCAYEFNLSSFIKEGYGKHIYILKQETRDFNEREDYNQEEKQKIVLKTLILLTYIKKSTKILKKTNSKLYHNPLLLTLVNSVNTENADLRLFFKELEKIGAGKIQEDIFDIAKKELLEEFKARPKFNYEEELKIDLDLFETISKEDILKYVYNAQSHGEIEVIENNSNKQELAFKLTTGDRPFALIKIGDITNWLKSLEGYKVQERFENESYFRNLNDEASDINILMGSRAFYEGWDSNRPNIITFINIGVGEEAKKFILQSIGRGVRIEPIKNKRKRLLDLYNKGEIDEDLYKQIKDKIQPIETLFIFSPNRDVLSKVTGELEKEEKQRGVTIELSINPKLEEINKPLLIPKYKSEKASESMYKFKLTEKDYNLLGEFINYIEDDRIFLIKYNIDPQKVKLLRERKYIEKSSNALKPIKNIDLILQLYFGYFSLEEERLDDSEPFKYLEDEIKHFKNIKVYLEDITELNNIIYKVSKYHEKDEVKKRLKEEFNSGKITLDQYTEKIEEINEGYPKEGEFNDLIIKHIAEHYYIPIILSEDERIDYIKHIIKVRSEVDFIKDLEKNLSKFKKDFDWWMFSKIDESLDDIYIPYYNPNINKIAKFKPDFIFWLQKENNYYIVFVDPKSTEYTDAERKIDGFEKIFTENGISKEFEYENLRVKVKLFYISDRISSGRYQDYWVSNIEELVEKILEN
ncbi:MAG: restriction endonuclease subunit R, partial [Candidatus Omnitrophica bacterium]|nr:restriction endonuclease subunit R [Candidatus Omnitrophota bacterium]